MTFSKDALYLTVNGFETKCTASFIILMKILLATRELDLFRALIARSTYPMLTVCSLKLALLLSFS